jgi:hypothetical protein
MSYDPSFIDSIFFTATPLTATGATEAFKVFEQNLSAPINYVAQITVASITTSVVVKIEGSLDGTNYFNLNSSGNTTISANGTTFLSYTNIPLKYIRGNLVTITAGTPTVSFVFAAR